MSAANELLARQGSEAPTESSVANVFPIGAPRRPIFGEWLGLRVSAVGVGSTRDLPLPQAEDFSRALRGALLHHASDPPPHGLHGHAASGAPTERPHIACVSLPDLDPRRRGPASIRGAAIVFPRDLPHEELLATLLGASRWEQAGLRLWMGRLGSVRLERDTAPDGSFAPAAWSRASDLWATVTPIALDRHPGDLDSDDLTRVAQAVAEAEASIATSCERIGLPRPVHVRVLRKSRFPGLPPAGSFAPYPRRGGRSRHACVHAEIRFSGLVEGPVLLGAGRFCGVGLCRPL